MSLPPEDMNSIPEQTILVVRAAFPKGNLYIKMRDALGTFYQDQDFAGLFPSRGQPALAPWRLALITIMQFAENLTDRQAANAVRARIDWKYALALELTDSGFDYSVLSEFRSRLVAGEAASLLFELMLNKFKEQGLLLAGGKQRTDSTHVLAAVRELNRIEAIAETLRAALNALAVVAPNWLREQVTSEWFERYAHRVEDYRLPQGLEARKAYVEVVGTDGVHLLQAISVAPAPLIGVLEAVEAVKILRRMWLQHFYFWEDQLRLRDIKEVPPTALRIEGPYDPEARYSEKRTTKWTGYKIHLTESCDEEQPHLLTHVETTQAQVPDVAMTETIHAQLAEKELLPAQHLVDMGYTDIELLLNSKQTYGVELVGPLRPDGGWQAAANNGFGAANFKVDWKACQITCPLGKVSREWKENQDRHGNPIVQARFSRADCASCSSRILCTRSADQRRSLTLRTQAEHEALQRLRQQQQGEEFKKAYALRSGAESTLSQGIGVFGLRKCRYLGLAKTHLQHVATGAAINLVRAVNWLAEREEVEVKEKSRYRTRPSPFGALAFAA